MKMIVLLLTTAIMQVSASTFAQKITLNKNKAPLSEIFNEIRNQSGYDFLYNNRLLDKARLVTIHVKDASIEQVLELCFSDQPLTFKLDNKAVLVREKEASFIGSIINRFLAKDLSGRIVDENNHALAGVSVKLKGSGRMTNSDKNGSFSFPNLPENAVLQFSYIGYTTREIALKEMSDPVVIQLKQDVGKLDQVQITAYGTTTKRLNAGNITTITSKDIEKNPVNNVLEALRGNVPGLFVEQATGQPGGAFNVRLRGSANFASGTAEPLVIVDGVRYPSGTLNLYGNGNYGTSNFLKGGSGLNYINPNDIESVDILKDINATAIYGSSGAYGVILITTKKAKAMSQSFNANIYTGVSVLGEATPLLNTQEYLMLRREALANDGLTAPASDNDLNGVWPEDRYTDWRKEFLGKAAATTNVNLSLNGGNQNSSYLIGGTFRDMGNIQRHNGANRDGSVRVSLSTRSNDNKFEMALSGTFLASTNDMVPYDFSLGALTPPNAPPAYNADGSLNWESIGTDLNGSKTASNINRLYQNKTNNLMGNLTLTYKPVSKVILKTIFGYNNLTGTEEIGYPSSTFHPEETDVASKTVGAFNQYNNRSVTVSPYAEYRTTIAKKGELSIKLGGEVNNRLNRVNSITGTGFSSDGLIGNPSVANSVVPTYNLTEYRSIGTYALMNFVWNNRYVLDINARRDGSTKFGPGRRFGNFGSAALAWIFSEEALIKDNLPWFSFGKLRASSGVVGGDAIGDFQYLGIYSAVGGQYGGKGGLGPSTLPNPLLNWERNKNSEVGIELGFFNNRITTDVSYYHNEAGNQLLNQPLPFTTGFPGYSVNSDALIRTTGTEINFSTVNIRSANFNWSTRINMSIPKSKILRLPTQRNAESNFVLNKPVTGIRLYKYIGVNPETGDYRFANAEGVEDDYLFGLDNDDKTEFVDLSPKYFGGIQNSFSYKRLSLDFTFTFTKRMGKNMLGQVGFPFGLYGLNGSTIWLDRWQKPGDVTDIPKISTQFTGIFRHMLFTSSTGAYQDATYARLQNVSLRYALSDELSRKLRLKNLSVYLQGQNLLTISNFGGLDPENLDINTIPPLRVFTAGLNVTF